MGTTQEWFDELYIKNSRKMVSIAMRLGFSPEEAEELMQDAFLLLLSKSEQFRCEHENPGGFLMESLKNLMGTQFQRKRILQFVPYNELSEVATTDTYFSSLIDQLPEKLSKEERSMLVARYEEQVPYAELSRRLGVSPKQCAIKVFRAKKKLQKILEDEEDFSNYGGLESFELNRVMESRSGQYAQ